MRISLCVNGKMAGPPGCDTGWSGRILRLFHVFCELEYLEGELNAERLHGSGVHHDLQMIHPGEKTGPASVRYLQPAARGMAAPVKTEAKSSFSRVCVYCWSGSSPSSSSTGVSCR